MVDVPHQRKPRVRSATQFLVWLAYVLLVLAAAGEISAQSTVPSETQPTADGSTGMSGMDMGDHRHMTKATSSAESFFMDESSGTAVQPSAWPMPMVMNSVGDWSLMWMGQAFLVDTQQTGPL